MADEDLLARMAPQLELLLPELDERSRRLVLGAVARAAGEGGTGTVARAAGASWQTVAGGAAELASGDTAPAGRVRRPGGGRKRLADTDPGLVPALLALVEDSTRGDPESPLRWTTRSLQHLADALTAAGHPCGRSTVWRLLREQGFSLQSNAKVKEGTAQHPDRDAQFRHIAARAREFMDAGQPVVSVDAKKKEPVGDFAQHGREWARKGSPVQARDHSFPDRDGGHAIPYGVYDAAADQALVNIGTGGNTASLAVESLRRWHGMLGKKEYPDATRLLVTCDAGGSNGWANRAWKKGLAAFAQEAGLEIAVAHFPPGTSKWNKIEHRLFSRISCAWRGRPLASYEVIIETVSAVTGKGGLSVTAVMDHGPHPKGEKVTDAEMRGIEERCLTRCGFHGEWNYSFLPVPRPAPGPEPEPEPPGWPRASLNSPALTGMDPAAVTALAAALDVPLAARREHDLHHKRQGPRRGNGRGRPSRFTRHDHVLAALIARHLGIALKELAPAFGMTSDIIYHGTRPARKLLAAGHGPPAAPPPDDAPGTCAELAAYAARHGITGIPPPTPPQKPHYEPPTRRELNLFWDAHLATASIPPQA